MAPRLCLSCSRIPLELFREENDAQGLLGGMELVLAPLNVLKHNATLGCQLCRIFTASMDVSFLPSEVLDQEPVRIRRAIIGSHQAVQAYISADDVSVTYFSRIPKQWVHAYPPRGYDEPDCELQLMQTWLSQCQENHPMCQGQSSTVGPRRLLDLRVEPSNNDIRLVELLPNETQPFLPFVCLSHCWGPATRAPKRTTKSHIQAHKATIAIADLSNTFKDAIRMTRDLGYRYLWIDSLCIVQDDPEDWEREAQNMPNIYGSSALTLAALSSPDGTYGCRTGISGGKPPSSWRRIDVTDGRDHVRFYEEKPAYWYEEYGDDPYKYESYGRNPLRTRAWTLQERELPIRSIHFSDRMLLWQCRTMKGSSELPWGEIQPMDDFLPPLIHNSPGEDLRGDVVALRSRWLDIVEDYTTRFMSLESDKLPALQGLATKYMEEIGVGRYLSGVFEVHFPSALLWRVRSREREKASILSAFQPRRPMKRRAPSWSWASLDGAVTYDSQRLTRDVDLSRVRSATAGDFAALFRFGQQHCVQTNDDIPEDKALLVTGRLASLQLETAIADVEMPLEGEGISLLDKAGMPVGIFYPDIPLEVQSVGHVVCLPVRREPYWADKTPPSHVQATEDLLSSEEEFDKNPMMMGLGLMKATGGPNVYRRIAMVRWVASRVFENVDEVELTIV